eukprot:TRINITY_DN1981_c0_g1_i7.p1 TRINITY_DN1981_c0_g1~~TRINITY_DN1981_c0_g1_i7.p1  ORF type:complete len:570 (-),score=65.38 TRINITY_DN1981_c0_g1_i7:510-2219(-)
MSQNGSQHSQQGAQSLTAQNSFHRNQSLIFKEVMSKRESRPMVRKIKQFLTTYKQQSPDSNLGSQMVQRFLNEMSADFRKNDHYRRASEADKEGMEEALEKYITYQLYDKCFGRICEEQRERDDCVNRRLEALQDTQPHHFEIDGQFLASTQLRNLILLAQKELGKVDGYRAPREKLQCVMNCCHVINKILDEGSKKGETHGADGFLPLLNFVVVMVNPTNLVSNVTYVQKFRGQQRISSEESYYLTNLEAIVDWSETLQPSMISMDKQEFYDRMRRAGFQDIDIFHTGEYSQKYEEGGDASGTSPLIDLTDMYNHVSLEKSVHGASIYDQTLSEKSSSTNAANQNVVETGIGLLPEVSENAINSQQSGVSSSFSPLGPLPSIAQLESAGWRQVLDANATGELQALHPLLEFSAEDLTLESVRALFVSYRSLAVKYEKLSLAATTQKPGAIHACSDIKEVEQLGYEGLSQDAGTILSRYMFFSSELNNLTIKDVGMLVVQYKDLALRYEALCRALCQHLGISREVPVKQDTAPFAPSISQQAEDGNLETKETQQYTEKQQQENIGELSY